MTSAAGHSRFCLKEQKKQSVYQVLEGYPFVGFTRSRKTDWQDHPDVESFYLV